ncbi:MAG TPA: 2,3-dihydroxybenzoate-AMP ligase [Pusillimonas sp.]|nr:2,3-dihydroxybenzoate-AMP ligase [Pusillimonas sp.]
MTQPLNRIDGVVYPDAENARFYTECGAWERRTMGQALRDAAQRVPDQIAYVCHERRITFAQLNAETDRLAAGLRKLGLRLHDRAMFQMGTNIDTVIALFGCFKAGVIPVCSIPQFREIEIGTLAKLTQPKGYFVQQDAGGNFDLQAFAVDMAKRHDIPYVISSGGEVIDGVHTLDDLCAESQPVLDTSDEFGAGDVAVFQLSGGSTGVPKIIPRFHGEYLAHGRDWCNQYEMEAGNIGIWALPVLHNAGMLFSIVRAVAYPATTVLMPRWDVASYFEMIDREKVQFAFTIGPHAPAIASYPHVARHDLSSLKMLFTLMGAESIERATGVCSTNMFGITEGLILTGTPGASAEIRHGSIGMRCSPNDEIRILEPDGIDELPVGEVGELCFRGPSSLHGYYSAPDINAVSFTPDGFFRTGDMVRARRIDNELVYCFEGRMRDNINRGGEKFGTEDIEHLIARHPAIADGKVVAMPDEIYGEKACAFLIAREGCTLPTVKELGAFLLEKGLAKYKLPERIEPCESFPVTRVGKLDRAALRALITEKLTQEVSK